jgi:Tfp pilus assembly protein FimT
MELVVVLAIVGVAFAFAIPPLGDGLRRWRLQGAVREMTTIMKFTRNQSVARRMPLQVVMDKSRGLYWLDRLDAPALEDPRQAEEKGIRLYALPTGIRFGDVTIGDVSPAEARVGMPFYPKGHSTGGAVQLLDERGRDYRVRVDPVTGHARVQREP